MRNLQMSPSRDWSILYKLMLFFGCLVLVATGARANNVADCGPITDPDVNFQLDLCSAHVGCKFAIAVVRSCERAKQFVKTVAEKVEGKLGSIFGRRKEIDANDVVDAQLESSDAWRKAETLRQSGKPDERTLFDVSVPRSPMSLVGNEMKGKSPDGKEYIYYGSQQGGVPNGIGVRFFSDGSTERGEFSSGSISGSGEVLSSKGEYTRGRFIQGKLNGSALRIASEGQSYEYGQYQNGQLERGVQVSAEGKIVEGRFSPSAPKVMPMRGVDQPAMAALRSTENVANSQNSSTENASVRELSSTNAQPSSEPPLQLLSRSSGDGTRIMTERARPDAPSLVDVQSIAVAPSGQASKASTRNSRSSDQSFEQCDAQTTQIVNRGSSTIGRSGGATDQLRATANILKQAIAAMQPCANDPRGAAFIKQAQAQLADTLRACRQMSTSSASCN